MAERNMQTHFDKVPWLPMRDLPGFDGADHPGMSGKFFGDIDEGPWFYLIRHEPGTRIPRHTHSGSVTHYMLEGEWNIDGDIVTPGHWHYELPGTYWGPVQSGSNGSLIIAVYDRYPTFQAWRPGVDDWNPPDGYGDWAL